MAAYRRMHHDEVDARDFDLAPRDAPPAHRIVICTTPRSGSYLLCRQMVNAGLGVPHEYFRMRTISRLAQRYGVAPGDVGAYVERLEAHRTTPNGVFATKLHWHQLVQFPAVQERVLERADLIVHLVRGDVVAQAVSWQLSLATGFWSFDATPGPRAENVSLDRPDQTLELVRQLDVQNQAWSSLFARLGRRVLRVPYETYAREQGALLRQLAADLALPPGVWTMPPAEGRDTRLPDEVERARERLLAHARAAAGS
jgi:LPS sulfotransferase NodH